MEQCRCRRPAGKVKCHTRRVRQKIPDNKRAEASHRDLRERSGVGEGAAAAGRTHGRAGQGARRGTPNDLLHDAGIEASGRSAITSGGELRETVVLWSVVMSCICWRVRPPLLHEAPHELCNLVRRGIEREKKMESPSICIER